MDTPAGPYLLTDCVITRRKRFHCVMHPSGAAMFKSRIFAEALDYVRALGLTQIELRFGDDGLMGPVLATLQLEEL